MQWKILQAMNQCQYKAWLLAKEKQPELLTLQDNEISLPFNTISVLDKIAITGWYTATVDAKERGSYFQIVYKNAEKLKIRLNTFSVKAVKLLENAHAITNQKEPPVFYKNKHCTGCPYWESCYPKLKEKDCISLLESISPNVVNKYNSKGIFTITQLSHLFRPRRRGRTIRAKFLKIEPTFICLLFLTQQL